MKKKKSRVWKILLYNGNLRNYQLGIDPKSLLWMWLSVFNVPLSREIKALVCSILQTFPLWRPSLPPVITKGGAGEKHAFCPFPPKSWVSHGLQTQTPETLDQGENTCPCSAEAPSARERMECEVGNWVGECEHHQAILITKWWQLNIFPDSAANSFLT